MTAPEVLTRDQLVGRLVEGRRAGLWRYLGVVEPGEYAVELDGGVTRQHNVAGMSAWLDGWAAGDELVATVDEIPARAHAPHEVRGLLNSPGVLDQRRIRVAHAMERRRWTYADVAAHLHAQRSTVRGLLRYGSTPTRVTRSSRKLAEVEALLPELRRGYGRKPGELPELDRVQPLGEARPEPAELRRARALALAVEAGLLVSWSPLDVTDLRAARVALVVDVAGVERPVRVAELIPWVQGLADGTLNAAVKWSHAERDQVSHLAHSLA